MTALVYKRTLKFLNWLIFKKKYRSLFSCVIISVYEHALLNQKFIQGKTDNEKFFQTCNNINSFHNSYRVCPCSLSNLGAV